MALLLTVAALLGATSALPNPDFAVRASSPEPVRILPYNWRFNITALEGPGCPDFGQVNPPYVTRPTFGQNTVDGSEIYYWFFAYPHLRASVGPDQPEDSIWCETTLSYTELDKDGNPAAKPGYRLKLHKNGTEILADYALDAGVEANWKFTYYVGGKDEEIVDKITVQGPRTTSEGESADISRQKELVQWALPDCGSGTIKYRTELSLKAKKDGAKGTVSSEQVMYLTRPVYYGVQQGVSYDWEKCKA